MLLPKRMGTRPTEARTFLSVRQFPAFINKYTQFILLGEIILMSTAEKVFSIAKVDGEVMLHDGSSGWVRARAGMTFRAGYEITLKTGSTGHAEIINARGEHVNIAPKSLKVINGDFSEDDIETLRNIRLTAWDMMSARIPVRQPVAPAF